MRKKFDSKYAIAKKHGLAVIEDDAQCFLGKYKGKTVGTLGDIASFSFQSSKHMTCGEGGMLITRSAELADLIRYAGAHLAKYGIRVNAITPGPFPNEKTLANAEFAQKLADKTMLRRVGHREEIKGAIVLLASDASSFMTGSNVTVDGGWTAW